MGAMKSLPVIKTLRVDFSSGNGEVIINETHRFKFNSTPEYSQLDDAYIHQREYSATITAPKDWELEYLEVFWAESENMDPNDAMTWADWDTPSAFQVDVSEPVWLNQNGKALRP